MTRPQLSPPAVGARGFRLLDGLRFACEVVAVDSKDQTLRVWFLDAEAAVEDGVALDEFELDQPLSPSENETKQPLRDDRFLFPVACSPLASQCVLGAVVSFLEPLEWLASLCRVCRSWRTELSTASCWRLIHARSRADGLNQLLDVRLSRGQDQHAAVRVRDVVEVIVLGDSDIADDQVVSAAMKCSNLKSLSLRRCQRVSFMVVYELLRLSRERSAAGEACLQSLDLWLCRGVSPTFVSQLMAPPRYPIQTNDEPPRRHQLDIRGPGFFFLDASQADLDTLRQQTTLIPHWPTETSRIDVLWLPETVLLEILSSHKDSAWQALQRHAPVLKAAVLAGIVSLVLFNRQLTGSENPVYLGIPASPVEDLTQLIEEWEASLATRTQLTNAVRELAEQHKADQCDAELPKALAVDPLTAQAERVFAMLRETTEQLQSQVDRLENQVAVMAEAKRAAEREYQHAERELQRIAQEADRAVLALATSSDPTRSSKGASDITPSTIEPPPHNGVIVDRPGDALLPPLPSGEAIAGVAKSLEQQCFAVLDGFVGGSLSSRVRQDVERMYRASRAVEAPPPPAGCDPLTENPPALPPPARFSLGELAGGNTGRNLRYQMAHVRGDYMLWLDEGDEFCPLSVRFALRQLDRLVLERLSVESHELSMSALLRKKAMVTCYPGDRQARYTRHCDNPNRNGRKLTAILYLNPDWDASRHGGELLVHRGAHARTIAPLLDRLVLFFSDARVPHEVLRCKDATQDRFALTVWYLDYDEYMHAQVFGSAKEDGDAAERERIEKEMERFGGGSDAVG